MAQTVKEMAEILQALKTQNENDSQDLNSLLLSIGNKLDSFVESNDNDSIKVYVEELKTAFENRAEETLSMFNMLEGSLQGVLFLAEGSVKNSDIQELSLTVSEKATSIIDEINSQRDILTELDKKLAENNSSDANDNNINVQDELEKLFKNVEITKSELNDLAIISHSVMTKLEDISENIETTSTDNSSFQSEAMSFVDTGLQEIKDKIYELYSVNENIASQSCNNLKNAKEEILANFATIQLNDFDDIQDKLSNISEVLEQDLSSNNDKHTEMISFIDSGLQEVLDNVSKINTSVYASMNDAIVDNLKELEAKYNSLLLTFQNYGSDNEDIKQDLLSKIEHSYLNINSDIENSYLENKNSINELTKLIQLIRTQISEQQIYINELNIEETAKEYRYSFNEMLMKTQSIEDIILEIDFDKKISDLKEDITSNMVTIFDQISFTEEVEEIKEFVDTKTTDASDDIKDFFTEKSSEISGHFYEVSKQLNQIANGGSDFDNIYTLQDLEKDIAKLRLTLNNISEQDTRDEVQKLTYNIDRIINQIEYFNSFITTEKISGFDNSLAKLDEDIVSISARTNKIIINSEEINNEFKNHFERFDMFSNSLNEQLSTLSKQELVTTLNEKIDTLTTLMVSSMNSNKIFQEVLGYIGEWVDTTGLKIDFISTATNAIQDKANQIEGRIFDLDKKVSEISNVKNLLDELKNEMPDKEFLINNIEQKFETQELRIDRLETKLDKILSIIEKRDDMILTTKMEKIEREMIMLGTSMEKLSSYVD
ncbi:MAG: hypothetical protein R3Y28_04040 [Candidatus Gastranaerophilales bacterium]